MQKSFRKHQENTSLARKINQGSSVIHPYGCSIKILLFLYNLSMVELPSRIASKAFSETLSYRRLSSPSYSTKSPKTSLSSKASSSSPTINSSSSPSSSPKPKPTFLDLHPLSSQFLVRLKHNYRVFLAVVLGTLKLVGLTFTFPLTTGDVGGCEGVACDSMRKLDMNKVVM